MSEYDIEYVGLMPEFNLDAFSICVNRTFTFDREQVVGVSGDNIFETPMNVVLQNSAESCCSVYLGNKEAQHLEIMPGKFIVLHSINVDSLLVQVFADTQICVMIW